jgi:hypothetical protein
LTITGSVQQHRALIETKQEEGREILIKCEKINLNLTNVRNNEKQIKTRVVVVGLQGPGVGLKC